MVREDAATAAVVGVARKLPLTGFAPSPCTLVYSEGYIPFIKPGNTCASTVVVGFARLFFRFKFQGSLVKRSAGRDKIIELNILTRCVYCTSPFPHFFPHQDAQGLLNY